MENFIADTVLMVRPISFGYNEQTGETNAFQNKLEAFDSVQVQQIAELEFDNFVDTLRGHGIEVLVYQDQKEPPTPDSIFPNNWFSTCPHTKSVFTYPMKNDNRSAERRQDIIQDLANISGYKVNESFIEWESKNLALEGTGSLLLDHQNKVAYVALSPRTEAEVFNEWCDLTGFKPVSFNSFGPAGEHIYHTNVMMTLADEYVIVALSTIRNENERNHVISNLEGISSKFVIDISAEQMNHFAGNMLQLQNKEGVKFLVMSKTAERYLTDSQKETITKKFGNQILAVPINMIETIGGGSARCMMGEVFKN